MLDDSLRFVFRTLPKTISGVYEQFAVTVSAYDSSNSVYTMLVQFPFSHANVMVLCFFFSLDLH
jgi:hypothetical protein